MPEETKQRRTDLGEKSRRVWIKVKHEIQASNIKCNEAGNRIPVGGLWLFCESCEVKEAVSQSVRLLIMGFTVAFCIVLCFLFGRFNRKKTGIIEL
jgi:hypothetical protein